MKIVKQLLIILGGMMVMSCHQMLDYGVNWDDCGETEQATHNGYQVTIEQNENSTYQKAVVADSDGHLIAYITKQKEDDVSTVIKYLHNDSGEVRGMIAYPDCYPMPKREGNALKNHCGTNELAEYKERLWEDYDQSNHPNDIGLALVFDNCEDRSYVARYYFRYDDDRLIEVYDSISGQSIKAGEGEKIDYQVMVQELLLTNDSVIGDMLLHFMVRPIEITEDYIVRTYCGYRPMDEMEFEGGLLVRRKIYRSDCPEVYMMKEKIDIGSKHVYKLICDYEDKSLVSTYEGGIIKKVEEISRWGTVLKQDVYFESADKEAYICFLKSYNYQKGCLVKVREERIDKEEFFETMNESNEMNLQPHMEAMWERFTYDVYGFGLVYGMQRLQ